MDPTGSQHSAGSQEPQPPTPARSTAASPATAGKINLIATATQTTAIEEAIYVYDLEIESSAGSVTRILEGQVTVTPEVTR